MANDGRIEMAGRLFAASYKGVPIYVARGNVTGGRKATKRPIVNSDEQNVSDVGQKQRDYTIEAYVAARYKEQAIDNDSGISSDYPEQRRTILAALEDKTPGSLVHPWEGEITNLVCENFDLEEVMTEVGIGRLSLTFFRKTVNVTPAESLGSAIAVDLAAQVADASFIDLIEGAWGVDLSVIDSVEDAIGKVQDAYDAVQKSVAVVESVAAEINGFASSISSLTSDLASIITSPLAIATSVQNLFTSIENIFPTLDAKFDAMVSGFTFGDLDIEFSASTPSGRQKRGNFDAINTAMRGSFLTNAYTAATGLDLTTLERIEEVEKILDEQHSLIVEGDAASSEVKSALQDVRTTFFDFLATARVSALRLSTEDVTTATPRVLAYQFYGSDDLANTLSDINGVESYELISGTAEVLSS